MYFELFEHIRSMGFQNLEESGLYEGVLGDYYTQGSMKYKQDIHFFKYLLNKEGTSILELCAGDGRVTVPLLKSGFSVTAVELSPDMYRKLLKRVEGKPKLESIFKGVLGDIFEISYHEEFDGIILAATTICLFSYEEIKKIFEIAYESLKIDGLFLFDIRLIQEEMDTHYKPIKLYETYSIQGEKYLFYLDEFYDKKDDCVYINLLADNGMKKILGYDRKNCLSINKLEEIGREVGFKQFKSEIDSQEEGCYMKIISLRK